MKSIKKLISVLLVVSMLFSTVLSAVSITSFAEETPIYYVSATGFDQNTAKTADAAALTVEGAIQKAVDYGYSQGDTVTVKVVGTSAVAWGVLEGEETNAFLPSHEFKLIIESQTSGATVGDNTMGVHLGGDTEFKNITVFIAKWPNYYSMFASGHNLIFGSDVTYKETNVGYMYVGTCTGEGVYDEPINIEMNSNFQYLFLSNSYHKCTFNKDITVVANNSSANPIFYFGSNGSTVYNANVNINIKNSASITLRKGTNATFCENSALQIVNSSSATINDEAGVITGIAAGKSYIFNNKTGMANILAFTETAGKYAVDTNRYTVIATPTGSGESVVAKDGFLEVEPGEYTITATKISETVTYYIASTEDGGKFNNDGLTATTPLLTVADAISKANEYGLLNTDILVIKVVGTTANATWGDDVKSNAGVIKIESNDYENLSTIVPPAAAIGGEKGGLVEFDNIKIKGVEATHNPDKIIANGRSITIGANAVVVANNSALYPAYQATTINNTLTYTIKNAYKGQLYLTHWNNNGITYKGDLNYIVNNPEAVANFKISSSYNSDSANKIEGNLNIAVLDAMSVTFENKGTKGNPYYNILGALQVVTPANIEVDITNFATIGKNDSAPAGGVYHIINATGVSDAIEFTKTAGTYKINYTNSVKELFLFDEDGNSTKVESNQITVEPGVYRLMAIGSYLNDAEKIKVYDDCEIDLSKEEHLEKDGKLFIGWQKSNGSWASKKATYEKGEVLTAKYIDFTDIDFEMNNISLSEENGLKLNVGYNETVATGNIPNVSENGIIWIETDKSLGREIRVDAGVVKSWTWETNDKDNFKPSETLEVPKKVANTNVTSVSIASADYNTYYTTRAYIKFTDNNGMERIVYTVEETVSAYKVAKEAKDNKSIYETIIKKVEADNKEYLDGITETVVSKYDKQNPDYKRNTDSYDVFSNISGAGDYVQYKRDVVLTNTGVKESINLGWLTDMHIFNVSQTDVDKQMTNILATYRGSAWLRVYKILERADNQIKYTTARYNKTIISGDIADNYCYGSFSAIKAIVADKSVGGGILMTTGNHEFMEHVNTDVQGLVNKYTTSEKYGLIKKAWVNDPNYYAEILKTSKGEDNAMVVLLDNGSDSYAEGTAQKLQASIDLAKEKNIPVLIFQHIPMSTYNETETQVSTGSPTTLGLSTDGDGGYLNMSNYKSWGVDVHEVIRKNYDVIKGVFCGHVHRNMYTEITALDEDGNIIPDVYIPQFITGAADQGIYFVNEITLTADCEHSYDDCDDVDCNLCGSERAPLCHISDNGTIIKQATCTKTGIKTYTCTVCTNVIENETIPKIAHSYNAATCTEAQICKVCGYESGNPLGHDIEIVNKPATEDKDGKVYELCDRCDKIVSKSAIYKIKTVKLETSKYTYNGKTKTPSIVVKDSKGKTISSKYYTVYGTKSAKAVGKYEISIVFKTKYEGAKSLSYEIVAPTVAKSSVSKLTAAKKSLKVSIKKASKVSGYEIEYSLKKNFKSSKKKTTSKTSYTIKSLKAKKTYYIRVRSYKKIGSKKFYSAWSSVKLKKTK